MIGILILAGMSLVMHPTRETLAELQWNPDTHRIEVSFRLTLVDEQSLLSQKVVQDNEKLARDASKLLAKHFRFGTSKELGSSEANAQAVRVGSRRYHWIGRQPDGGHVWWHFEYNTKGDRPTHVRCNLLAGDGVESNSHRHAAPIHRFNVITVTGVRAFSSNATQPITAIRWGN